MHILINKKYFVFNQYKVKCAIGKRGIGLKKKEGDFITPIGQYKIKYILYRKDRIKKIQSKLRKIVIKKNMGWCDDPKSKSYNKLINFPFNYSAENLYRNDDLYDIIFVIDYNMNPVVKNKGSAIFLHVANDDFMPTEGCIAIQKNELLMLSKFIDKNTTITMKI